MKATTRYFEEYEVGQTWETMGRTITETDIVYFCTYSTDFHPAAVDVEFSKQFAFGNRISPGMLTFQVSVGLAGEWNLAARTVGHDRLRYPRPTFAGDTIRVRATVVDTSPAPGGQADAGLVTIQYEAANQRNETVLACRHFLLVQRAGV